MSKLSHIAMALWIGCAVFVRGASDGVDFFETRVRPVLAEHCYECHSAQAKKVKGGLLLDRAEGLTKGGESGALFVSGKAEESRLVKAIGYADADMQMPPTKGGVSRKLSAAAIADIAHWIELGAALPQEGKVASANKPKKEHWAFVAPVEPVVPAVKNVRWPENPVDRFVLRRLEENGARPAEPADKRTLLRRASYDLTGLPPTKREVDEFLADTDAGAFGRVVERLLNSPQYGERWGRRWLDIARYADTKGYVYAREERFFLHAWAYRDWVVSAFNRDLPYDRFLQLQIAADQLVPAGSPDLAAMGFVTGGRRFIGVTRDIIDDRIDVVTRGTMALTVACARCHDHKYDPIPTRDYYALYGVFDAATETHVPLGPEPADEEFRKLSDKFAEMMKKRRDEAETRLRARVGDYLAAQLELHKYPDEGFDQIFSDTDIIPASVRRWRDYLHRVSKTVDPIFGAWNALAKVEPEKYESALEAVRGKLNPMVAKAFESAPKSMAEAAERYGKLFAEAEKDSALAAFLVDANSPTVVPDTSLVNNEQFFPTSVCEELWKFQGDVERWLIKEKKPAPYARVLFDREPERDPRVFIRGNPARLGDEVKRQFPGIASGKRKREFQKGSGRLEMARAITDPSNPLTARVMVNRIWQGHFGTGLVKTASDFGLRAEDPSHPELLDWLAIQFVKSGWSMKAMHRLIMLSATYQQSSVAQPLPLDPDNRLLSRFPSARLDFEQMRDSMLSAAGELDSSLGGKAAELFDASNKRRTIYGLVDRQFLPTTFRVFDFANPDLSIGERHATTVPQQALFFLNNQFVADRARRLAKAEGAPEKKIRAMYESVYQRAPSEKESARGLAFIEESTRETPPPPPKPIPSQWQYGWGEYDAAAKKTKTFKKLPHFTGKAWQGGADFPNGTLGWVQLTATGGHPGNDLQHAAIRRWTAPAGGVVSISGELIHEPEAGDGIRAFVVSSRHGELKTAALLHSKAAMAVEKLEVMAGDTIDFIVDIKEGLNSDQFLWAPIVAAMKEEARVWDAQKEFAGPTPAYMEPLGPWEQYAQALLLANEFSFID